MLKSLKEHPQPIRFIAYITYAICGFGVIASFATNNLLFLLLGELPLFLTAVGEIYYHSWFVQRHNQKNTSLNVKYFLFFGISILLLIYPPGAIKKFWTNINKKYTKQTEHEPRN
jgi:hypothetical protein